MSLSEKPFACSIKDCDMTFTNEDHLNWHQKKHDMMLNLGLANKQSEVADQTPTPTRFIRNCEEVGLFQDLQNVNPFDEFFRKAVEASKVGVTLDVQQNNSEDTLHTPHILPHIEENQKKLNTLVEDGNSHSNDFLQNVIPMTSTGNACELEVAEIVEAPLIVISDDDDIEKQKRNKLKSVKLKVKEVIQKKGKEKTQAAVTLVPFKSLACNPVLGKAVTNDSKLKKSENKLKKGSSSVIDEIREMNRAAQIRCRKRKKESQLKMQEEMKRLRIENERLRVENELLKKEPQLKMQEEMKRLQIENERLSVENEFLKGQIRCKIQSNTATSSSINKSNDATNCDSSTSNQQKKLSDKEEDIPNRQSVILRVVSPVTIPITAQQNTKVKRGSNTLRKIFPKIPI